jgi:outer membrane protein assembly factor BamB
MATGAAVLVAGGGTAAWLLRDKGETDQQSSSSQAKNKNNITSPAGTRIWGPLPLADPWTPPALGVEDVVVFADKAGGLVAHGAMDGKRRWAALNVVPSAEYRPLPGGLIVAADAAGTVYAYKATTGEEEWSAQADATMLLAVNDSAVFVMSRDKKVRAIDAKTQKTLWAVGLGFESGGAAAAEDRLVLHGDDGTVLALDARSGNKVWERESASSLGKLPAINGDTVLISGKNLSLINLKDGKELWSVPSEGASEYDQWNSGAIDGDFVYALDATMLHCRSLGDGAKVWTYEMHTTPAFYPPQVSGSFVCGSSGADPKSFDVVAIHKETGKKAWGYSQSSLKSPKLTANGNELLLIQNDLVTALSAGPA